MFCIQMPKLEIVSDALSKRLWVIAACAVVVGAIFAADATGVLRSTHVQSEFEIDFENTARFSAEPNSGDLALVNEISSNANEVRFVLYKVISRESTTVTLLRHRRVSLGSVDDDWSQLGLADSDFEPQPQAFLGSKFALKMLVKSQDSDLTGSIFLIRRPGQK
jgi:hypothetical protein